MKRLVYSPRIDVYVKSDTGVYDISPYVTDFSITRRTNQVSSATVTFRNPNFKWTNAPQTLSDGTKTVGPIFHPMDPIIITLTRLKDRPIQVFTGYCDATPYLQLFPGTCVIEASCTLKRLQYTFWDPGLPFVRNFLSSRGWEPNDAMGGIMKMGEEAKTLAATKTLTDSSIGGLIYDILTEVVGWKKDNIFIEELPRQLVPVVEKIFNQIKSSDKEAQDEFFDLLHQMIGTSNARGGGAGGDGTTGPAGGGGRVTASYFSGSNGACGSNDAHGGMTFAELSNNPSAGASGCDFSALGHLPCGTRIRVTLGDKSIVVTKTDVGCGGPGLNGTKRAIDLYGPAAQALGLGGLAVVRWEKV